MVIKKWIKNKWFRRTLFVLIGALGGFAYYYFIGCTGKACPITSNPYISIGYGSFIGFVLSAGSK
jgi:hypothetical protein